MWLTVKIVVVVVAVLLLGLRLWDAYRRESVGRRHMLDKFLDALDGAHIERTPWRYPRLEGLLDGAPARIDLIPDTLVQRTLPTLWLQATWLRPHTADVSVLLGRVGTEFMAENGVGSWPLRSAEGWPENTEVRGRGPGGKSLLHRLRALDLEAYPALKHVRVSTDSVMVSLRCARAERATYRILRAAIFPPDAVTAELVAEALAALSAVELAVAASGEAPAVADRGAHEEAS